MVENCDLFYKVKTGDTCEAISSANGLTVDDFILWNTDIGGHACTGLWIDYYVCISTVGHTPSKSTTTSSSSRSTRTSTISITTTVNGISTPTPSQPGMVSNCDSFYKVKSGDTCENIASANGITVNDLVAWNKEIGGAQCNGLWVDLYVCISILGHTPNKSTTTTTTSKKSTTTSTRTTTTSTKTTAIVTPTPVQTGMAKNCKKFHLVASGQTCDAIIEQYSITLANFISWNRDAGEKCTGLWAGYWACVGV